MYLFTLLQALQKKAQVGFGKIPDRFETLKKWNSCHVQPPPTKKSRVVFCLLGPEGLLQFVVKQLKFSAEHETAKNEKENLGVLELQQDLQLAATSCTSAGKKVILLLDGIDKVEENEKTHLVSFKNCSCLLLGAFSERNHFWMWPADSSCKQKTEPKCRCHPRLLIPLTVHSTSGPKNDVRHWTGFLNDDTFPAKTPEGVSTSDSNWHLAELTKRFAFEMHGNSSTQSGPNANLGPV